MQDDWRVSSKFTLNYGLRVEHQHGLREQNNNFTVGFDPNATSCVVLGDDSRQRRSDRWDGGADGEGRVDVRGRRRQQGNAGQSADDEMVAARRRRVFDQSPRRCCAAATGLLGALECADAEPRDQQLWPGRLHAEQLVQQTAPTPTVSLTNPFPNGLVQPIGEQPWRRDRRRHRISRTPISTAPLRACSSISLDFQRELTGSQSHPHQLCGRPGRFSGPRRQQRHGRQHQPARSRSTSPSARRSTSTVPNPFFGDPNAGPFATPADAQSAQLLRPYPQFLNVQRGSRDGRQEPLQRRRRRVEQADDARLGGRVSYTYSVLKDNQVGEANFYSARRHQSAEQLQLHRSMPACTTTNFAACYNPDAEYGTSLLDVPHRVILTPMVELPFGRGKKWGSDSRADGIDCRRMDDCRGDQHPERVPAECRAGRQYRASRRRAAAEPRRRRRLWARQAAMRIAIPRPTIRPRPGSTPAAFTAAPAFTFGNAPRTITDERSPGQFNVDAVFSKRFRAGQKTAEIKLEMLNLLNRVNVRALTGRNTIGNANFGDDRCPGRVHADHAVDVSLQILGPSVSTRRGRS